MAGNTLSVWFKMHGCTAGDHLHLVYYLGKQTIQTHTGDSQKEKKSLKLLDTEGSKMGKLK